MVTKEEYEKMDSEQKFKYLSKKFASLQKLNHQMKLVSHDWQNMDPQADDAAESELMLQTEFDQAKSEYDSLKVMIMKITGMVL